ncbi:GNAT family N-acetyltransferase [Fulvimarina endophytica]|uniref:GNAT family N-acetyltransferase n=1 Tax=Fulvimarina endophytica TaxID=2293836 RepID=A0A371X3B6_9HYPH|nr:GNAT family N-acetyltransferase [Fulvimarina endophytica]RFC63703.1 GNAT family N-acetyltransferase [Fulvimarina endophytica]
MDTQPSIRPAEREDRPAIWAILEPVLRAGETYALDRDLTEDAALDYWLGTDRTSFVALLDGEIRGTYYLKRNQAGGGSHVANCGYAVSEKARGRGLARAMALHSLSEAGQRGFRAMQFNFVVEANAAAVHLWRSLGFAEVGRLPKAFDHPVDGPVDALVFWRDL